MRHSNISTFLKENVSDQYAFFWEAYTGTCTVKKAAPRRLSPYRRFYQEEVDSKPPYLVFRINKKRYYAPLRRNPVLHRAFCGLSDNAGIVKFASAYGLLGFSSAPVKNNRGRRSDGLMLIESLQRWRREIAEMRSLVHLWELVLNKRSSLLSALLEWEKDGLYIIVNRKKELVLSADLPMAQKWRGQEGQYYEPVTYYINEYISRKVGAHVYPRILPGYKKKVYFFPTDLLSAMWLMFLWEVIGEVRPRQCPGCRIWFNPRRSTRKTCGDRCRKKMSRINLSKRKEHI
ncbi:MAG: hypothetical protein PHO26_10620 [Dehalococcoidia bacterium]|nr:hypothetical protein [Dehalococcoidia bacterium]MDD5494260.1 hypothetical protein [Dehalococcoidia bacterium]